MTKVNFLSYGILSGGYAPDSLGSLDHTFVISSESNQVTDQNQVIDNWNCWGRGKETINNGARLLSQGSALKEWAAVIYGTDSNFPTGLVEKVDGVCQNAANRLLVLAGVDVSAANANIYTILLYGKYGFRIQDFVNNVTTAAAKINEAQPNAISSDELQIVLSRISDDPNDELGTLESHFVSALPKALTQSQNDQLLVAYRDFQSKREQIYKSNHQDPSRIANHDAYQQQYGQQILPVFLGCVNSCYDILGPDDYMAIFKMLPAQVATQVAPSLLKTQ